MKSGEWSVPGGTAVGLVADVADKKPEAPKTENTEKPAPKKARK